MAPKIVLGRCRVNILLTRPQTSCPSTLESLGPFGVISIVSPILQTVLSYSRGDILRITHSLERGQQRSANTGAGLVAMCSISPPVGVSPPVGGLQRRLGGGPCGIRGVLLLSRRLVTLVRRDLRG